MTTVIPKFKEGDLVSIPILTDIHRKVIIYTIKKVILIDENKDDLYYMYRLVNDGSMSDMHEGEIALTSPDGQIIEPPVIKPHIINVHGNIIVVSEILDITDLVVTPIPDPVYLFEITLIDNRTVLISFDFIKEEIGAFDIIDLEAYSVYVKDTYRDLCDVWKQNTTPKELPKDEPKESLNDKPTTKPFDLDEPIFVMNLDIRGFSPTKRARYIDVNKRKFEELGIQVLVVVNDHSKFECVYHPRDITNDLIRLREQIATIDSPDTESILHSIDKIIEL